MISFTDWNLLRDPNPVGLANYEQMLADPLFWNALRITGLYVLANIPTFPYRPFWGFCWRS